MATDRFARRTRRLLAAGFAVSLLAACQPSVEEVIAEHRPAVEAVFGRLKTLAGTIDDTPPLDEDLVELGTEKVRLDGDDSNAIFIRAEHLAAPESASSDGRGSTRAFTVETCGEALRGEFIGAAKGADAFLGECGRAKYAVVLRTHVDEWAQIVDQESFNPGRYEGDVLLFRLDDNTLLGGFRVAAANSDQVSVEVDAAGVPIDPLPRLESDLSSQVFVGIEEGLRTHAPGSID